MKVFGFVLAYLWTQINHLMIMVKVVKRTPSFKVSAVKETDSMNRVSYDMCGIVWKYRCELSSL